MNGLDSIGKSVPHLTASLQVQGKAEFTDDIPLNKKAKHAAFVTSTIAHGRIKMINYKTDELKMKKFTIFTQEDLAKGTNRLDSSKRRNSYIKRSVLLWPANSNHCSRQRKRSMEDCKNGSS